MADLYQQKTTRPDGFLPPARVDSMAPLDAQPFDPRPPLRANTFAGASQAEVIDGRGPSENGSRASSRARSSRASDVSLRDPGSRRYQRAEAELRQHYAVLRAFLKGKAGQPPRTNRARDKLLRLSPVQFHELSTDVFDELQRRQAAARIPGRPLRQDVPPFLQPKPDFHEKRNQARQKLSSLQDSRFRDLSTDVFCELERRFPHFNPDGPRPQSRGLGARPSNVVPAGPNSYGPPPRSYTANGSIPNQPGFPSRSGTGSPQETQASELTRPMPKQFQSNTAIPTKSTMVEDDEDDDSGSNGHDQRSSDAFGLESVLNSPKSKRDTTATSMTNGSRDMRFQLPSVEMQEKIQELESRLQAKDDEVKRLSEASRLSSELQNRLDEAEQLNRKFRDELALAQAQNQRFQQDFQSQVQLAQQKGVEEWQQKHEQLQRQHSALEDKYQRQMRITEDASNQFKVHLAEIRVMAEASNSIEREEQLHAEVQRLEEQVKEWRARYARVKTQLGTNRSSTLGLNVRPDGRALNSVMFQADDGMISDVHITQFQLAIDELLCSARSADSPEVLGRVKRIVVAVSNITHDITRSVKDEETSRKCSKLVGKVSNTANNVITAAKNYVAAEGLSPVSLLDAAASHLTAAVVDLARTAKVRHSLDEDLNTESSDPVINNAGYFVVDRARRTSAAGSEYSAISESDLQTPVARQQSRQETYNSFDNDQENRDEQELEELKVCMLTGNP